MKITWPFDTTTPEDASDSPRDLNSGTPTLKENMVIKFLVGDAWFAIDPQPNSDEIEVPAKVLRSTGDVIRSGLTPVAGGLGPHQDYQFLHDSTEYTYTIREVIGGSVVEKYMPAGAQEGKEGTMVLYKGVSTIADLAAGTWTERLIRPFVITASDITNRDSGWPSSGSPPTVDLTKKIIVDNGGDGYNHV